MTFRAWRTFLTGVACGATVIGAVGAIWLSWKSQRSPEEAAIYDTCLAEKAGNTIACDALLRTFQRNKSAESAMKGEAARMLAAGFSKREVVQWATERGFAGKQLSDAVGISLRDLQDDKY
jgi:hypothetical protein